MKQKKLLLISGILLVFLAAAWAGYHFLSDFAQPSSLGGEHVHLYGDHDHEEGHTHEGSHEHSHDHEEEHGQEERKDDQTDPVTSDSESAKPQPENTEEPSEEREPEQAAPETPDNGSTEPQPENTEEPSEEQEPEQAAPESPDDESASEDDSMKAPDFTVYNVDGEEVKLSDFRGKPVVLNFWASWCIPCQSEMPYFETAYREYGEDIHFVMVNLTSNSDESMRTAKIFTKNGGYTFPVYYDTEGDAAVAYGIYSIPTTYFIYPDGTMAGGKLGMIPEDLLQYGIDLISSDEEA